MAQKCQSLTYDIVERDDRLIWWRFGGHCPNAGDQVTRPSSVRHDAPDHLACLGKIGLRPIEPTQGSVGGDGDRRKRLVHLMSD